MYKEQISFTNPNIPVFSRECSGSPSEPHFHSEPELISILSGRMTVETEAETITGEAGETIFINSNVPHATVAVEGDFAGKLVQFRMPGAVQGRLGYLYKFFNSSIAPAFLFKKGEDAERLMLYISEIVKEKNNSGADSGYRTTAYMYMIMSVLSENRLLEDSGRLTENQKAIERLLPVLEYIDGHYMEEVSLAALSNILGLNEYYFCRVFKRAMGSTATEYINFVRTHYAAKLLLTGKNILEISCETGFSSLSYFNRVFKRYFQYPPSVYRRLARRRI